MIAQMHLFPKYFINLLLPLLSAGLSPFSLYVDRLMKALRAEDHPNILTVDIGYTGLARFGLET